MVQNAGFWCTLNCLWGDFGVNGASLLFRNELKRNRTGWLKEVENPAADNSSLHKSAVLLGRVSPAVMVYRVETVLEFQYLQQNLS